MLAMQQRAQQQQQQQQAQQQQQQFTGNYVAQQRLPGIRAYPQVSAGGFPTPGPGGQGGPQGGFASPSQGPNFAAPNQSPGKKIISFYLSFRRGL